MSSRVLRAGLPAVLALVVAVGLVRFIGPSLSLHEEVLHSETSKDSGITYEHSGERLSSELYLVRVSRLTGTDFELRLGPGAESYYYPVRVGFGSGDPRIRAVDWRPDGVAVHFASGESVEVPAGNFRSVR